MTTRKRLPATVCLLTLLCFGWFAPSTRAQSFSDLTLDANRVLWTDLFFQAKSLLVTVTSDVQLAPFSQTESETLSNTDFDRLPPLPSTIEGYYLAVKTTVDPVFREAVEVTNQVWFNPEKATVLRRLRLRRGEDDFKKSYRFTREGVHRLRREPTDQQEAPLAPEQWTDVKETFYPYDLTHLGCPQVSEPSVLLFIASTAAVSDSKKPISLCVFGKRQLHHVRLRAEGTQPLKVTYIEKTGEAEVRKEGQVEAFRIALEAEPMASTLDEMENFSFFGLHRDIVIYIDPTLRVPIQVSGVIPTVGNVDLKLRQVRLRQRAD